MLLSQTKYGNLIINLIKQDIISKDKKGYKWNEYNEYGEIEVDSCFYDISQELESNILKLYKLHYIEFHSNTKYLSLEIEKEDFFIKMIDYVMGLMDEEASCGEDEDYPLEQFYNGVYYSDSIFNQL